jgi:uncharacterized cupin superfamily protein
MCAGFPAKGIAHHLVNRGAADAVVLDIGDRTKNDEGIYPNDELLAPQSPEGSWVFNHKDASFY